MDDSAAIIMRAWKDESYYSSLTEEQQAAIPPKPDNFDQLTDEQLAEAAGGTLDWAWNQINSLVDGAARYFTWPH